MKRPCIGITVDNVDSSIASGRYESNVAYSRAIAEAGGVPLLLPQEIGLVANYVDHCDGLMFTGGNDARSDLFGVPPHPLSCCIESQRQEFELALFDALAQRPQRPVLGVCLGMQLMSLHANGRMDQHLPDTLPDAVAVHQGNNWHPVVIKAESSALWRLPGGGSSCSSQDLINPLVVSSHHQAVVDAGGLRVIAISHDGVIEAVDDPQRPFYVGVQWHPERGQGLLNFNLIQRFVEFCKQS